MTSLHGITLFVLTCSCLLVTCYGGCADLGRCCPGKHSDSCKFEYGFTSGRFTHACYCDEFCVKSRDCCPDYQSYCLSKARDCVMSSWEPWSECNARCGAGFAERRRHIRSYPEYGGKECGARRQTRGCYHNDARCRNYEIAQIIPSRYNRKRNEGDYYQRPAVVDRVIRPSYCVNYRINYLSWSCKYASPYHVLEVGSSVCVECHDTAMDKEGRCTGAYENVSSRWKSLDGRPCSGTWVSEGLQQKNSTCDQQGNENSFIFV